MEQLVSILFFIVFFAGVYDSLTGRVPNWCTFSAVILGILLQTIIFGWGGLGAAILGVLTGFAIYFPLYFFSILGAGDVKLLMAIGAFTSYKFCFFVAIAAILIGAIYALGEVIWIGRFIPLVRSIWRFLITMHIRGLITEKPQLDGKRKFSFGLSMSIATALVIWLETSGRLGDIL